jgi:hypothetical protein
MRRSEQMTTCLVSRPRSARWSLWRRPVSWRIPMDCFMGSAINAENSFSVDGQPITDQQSKVFSNQIAICYSRIANMGPLLREVVFVGGCTTALLITDEAAAEVRPTFDVDVIAEITTYAGYAAFSERLRALGCQARLPVLRERVEAISSLAA